MGVSPSAFKSSILKSLSRLAKSNTNLVPFPPKVTMHTSAALEAISSSLIVLKNVLTPSVSSCIAETPPSTTFHSLPSIISLLPVDL